MLRLALGMWSLVAVALASDADEHLEVQALSEEGDVLPQERILLLQLGTVQTQAYDKIPGLMFDTEAERVNVASFKGCKNICNDRRNDCQSFSYQHVTKECIVAPKGMKFDPGSVMHIKLDQGGFFDVPGLSFYHTGTGEWLPTSQQSALACADICTKRKLCKAYKYEKALKKCSMTGKGITFDENWAYYSKTTAEDDTEQSQSGPEETTEEVVKTEQQEVKQLASEVQDQARVLSIARAKVVEAKKEAREHIEQQAADDKTLDAMNARLEAAKRAAEQSVMDDQDRGQMSKQAARMKTKIEVQKQKMEQDKRLAKFKLSEDQKEAKEAEDHKLARVQANVQEVEYRQKLRSEEHSLKANATMSKQAAQQAESEARQLDKQLLEAKRQLAQSDKDHAEQLADRLAASAQILHYDRMEAEEEAKAVAEENKKAVARAVALQKAEENGHISMELANLTALHKNLVAQQHSNMTLLAEASKQADLEIPKIEASISSTARNTAGLRTMLDQVHTKTQKIYVSMHQALAAHHKSMNSTNVTALDPKVTAMIENAQQEAAKAEAEAQKNSDAAIAKAKQAAEKANKLSKEQATKAHEKLEKAKAAQVERDRRAKEKLQNDYKVAMQDAALMAKTGLNGIKRVRDKAEKMEDEDEANQLLEQAKSEWRDKVRAAIANADRIKEAIPADVETLTILPHTAVEIAHAGNAASLNVTTHLNITHVEIAKRKFAVLDDLVSNHSVTNMIPNNTEHPVVAP